MCGICGIVHARGADLVDEALLRAMNDTLRRRGPDDEGVLVWKNFGIAMRRLAVIDLSTGRQPIYNEDRTVAVVCNGEIYNFRELRKDLEQKGHVFRTHSDTEVIVHLYETYGYDFPAHLRGMFAIAVLDMNTELVLLVRDRLGIKPLYYAHAGGRFYFASEIKALLRSGQIRRDINPHALDDYLTYLYTPAPHTIYGNIYAVLPGHMLICRNGHVTVKTYWDLAEVYRSAEERRRSPVKETTAVHDLFELLKQAVSEELVSDVPLGAFLSGGIDSSTVVVLMRKLAGKNVKTFSIGFGDSPYTELSYAREVARACETDHYELEVRPDMVALLPELVAHLDEPFADSSIVPTYLVSQLARKRVTVALSGDGGDESFAGYAWTRINHLLEPLRILPAGARKAVARLFDGIPLRAAGWKRVSRLCASAACDYRDGFLKRITCYETNMRKQMYTEQFQEQVRGYDAYAHVYKRFTEVNGIDHSSAMLYADTSMYLPDDNLKKVDRMSMAHSLEVRVPYLDHRIVEYAAGVPFSLKIKRMTTKYIVKKAFTHDLPPAILAQRKQGFAMPVHAWFRRQLKGFAQDMLLAPDARISAFIKPSYVHSLLQRHFTEQEHLGNHIFTLIMLELWLRSQDVSL